MSTPSGGGRQPTRPPSTGLDPRSVRDGLRGMAQVAAATAVLIGVGAAIAWIVAWLYAA